MSIEF